MAHRGARAVAFGYRRILVPLVEAKESEQAVGLACRLAAEHGATVTAVVVIEVPVELPLDADMTEEEERAGRLLAEARAIGDLYGVRVLARVVRGRGAGPAIVDQARCDEAEVVVLGAPRKRRASPHARVFGKTVDFVLKHAPSRVMVATGRPEPAGRNGRPVGRVSGEGRGGLTD